MSGVRQFWKDTRGDAVVEATFLFPIIVMIFAALVLLSIYLPLRAGLQRSTQYAATAIATERSDTWLYHDAASLTYKWFRSRGELGSVYKSVIGGLTGSTRDDEDNAKTAVINMEKKNILKPDSNLTVEFGVLNYIVYKEIVVTAKRVVRSPVNLSFIGFPDNITMEVTSTAVVVNGDEFIRDMDLAVDIMDKLFDLDGIFSGIQKIMDKFNDFLGI